MDNFIANDNLNCVKKFVFSKIIRFNYKNLFRLSFYPIE